MEDHRGYFDFDLFLNKDKLITITSLYVQIRFYLAFHFDKDKGYILFIPNKLTKPPLTMTAPRRSARIASKRSVNVEDSIDEPKPKKTKVVKAKSETVSKKEATVKQLEVEDEIPDMVLKDQDDKDVSLRQVVKDNKIVIIFVYPKASTPGCTRQACGFRDNYDDLEQHGKVYGLSADNVTRQKNFQTKQSLPYDLLSDPKRELIGILGCKKTPQSGIIRSHFVFYEGKLKFKRVKISPEVSVADGKKEVLELAKSLDRK